MSMDEALQTFIEESRDLLQQMEDSLLSAEQGEVDADTINSIFRAAHTIKGSAGLFGLDHVVEYTHVVESVLDRVRNEEITLDAELAALFLQTRDHIGELIDGEPDEEIMKRGDEQCVLLKKYLGGDDGQVSQRTDATLSVAREPVAEVEQGATAETDNWHISLRFGVDVLRAGMDPLSFIHYLATMGVIEHIVTVTDALPIEEDFDPESCYLGFEINFRSDADKASIENVFEFVRDDCELRILPPRSQIEKYLELILGLPEEDIRIGEILTGCGSLTKKELELALSLQSVADKTTVQPLGQLLIEQSMVQPAVVEAALDKQQKAKARTSGENSLIRVDAAKLDRLIDLIGELIISGAGVGLIAQQANMAVLSEASATMLRLVEDVRDSALNLRMVQIGATFNRFQRVVRDVSKELGKDIRLEISGADTELDKTVVEQIGDPLTHLVRNSMDHGIEPADLRLAQGKPVYGTLRLDAYHDSGSIVIEISDDGGGLNRQKILAKAVERGLVQQGVELPDKDIYALIFEAGFSTADAVSNLSGRGVGMDVVRRNIESLGGTIDLESTEGEGTTTRIRLPLTLAIIDGFLVSAGTAQYVIPQDMVVQCIEFDEAIQDDMDSGYLNLRGEVLPFIMLRHVFSINGQKPRRQNVVVVQYAGMRAGIVVDGLLGEFQTVIKPMGKIFGKLRGIGGFTILGSGDVALILDVQRLIQQAVNQKTRAMAVGE